MDIKIGDFQITADGTQFILFKKQSKTEKSKNPGEEFYSHCGYYSDFTSCLKEIPRHMLLRSDANTFDEVLYILREYKRMIAESLNPQFKNEKPNVPVPAGPIQTMRRTK